MAEGIGNPIAIFYRDGFEFKVNMFNGTWEGGYRGDGWQNPCKGGVTDMSHKGGAVAKWT